jgi:hypothetical protein
MPKHKVTSFFDTIVIQNIFKKGSIMEKKKYAIGLRLVTNDGKEERIDTEFHSIFVTSPAGGALEVTEYPVFGVLDMQTVERKHIFSYGFYKKIDYTLAGIKDAILFAFRENEKMMSNWLLKQSFVVPQGGGRWRFVTNVSGKQVIFAKGDNEKIDAIADSLLRRDEVRKLQG